MVYRLNAAPQRFNRLQRLMPEATRRMLTLRLRELEEAGIVHREVFDEMPPKVVYSLTGLGRTLMPAVEAMYQWGVMYALRSKTV
ncbi:winged helix-turn-helix transcriptional regulator [Neisseria chenwenguii]|uniref:winged helix-turn-helix transcriptional regulator n=1 Tax=Neisseria chenwenguii TaxID=1853278 RepID=UPI002D776DC5|nr:winged helix-turn-helix transcriptional regulator [Neisseria chenwenguii]